MRFRVVVVLFASVSTRIEIGIDAVDVSGELGSALSPSVYWSVLSNVSGSEHLIVALTA